MADEAYIKREYCEYSSREPADVFLYSFQRPWKALVKWAGRYLYLAAKRTGNGFIYRFFEGRSLKAARSYARKVDPSYARCLVPRKRTYYEIQIGKRTRPCAIVKDRETLRIERDFSVDEEFLFGLAPLADEADVELLQTWGFEVKARDGEGTVTGEWTMFLPFGDRDGVSAYFPGDGWADFRIPMQGIAGRGCSLEFRFKTQSARGKRREWTGAVSAPQIVKRRGAGKTRNILLLSGESMSCPLYLEQTYGNQEWPNLKKFYEDSMVFPRAYSPADSTLPFAASAFSGLLPSQHTIGNYALSTRGFRQQVLNDHLRMLSTLIKRQGFLTLAGTTANRFTSRAGWARGFDEYFNEFLSWKLGAPDLDNLSRSFYNLKAYDKFFFLHFDQLHESPYLSFNAGDHVHYYNLREITGRDGAQRADAYLYKMKVLDDQFGRLIMDLKRTGNYDNTCIILTGDHGAGIRWKKHSDYSLYEERVRVPLVVKLPDWAKADIRPGPVANSSTEIFRIIHELLEEDMPEYTGDLPQFQPEFSEYAFSETIMNPNREYRRYCLAMTDEDTKYVSWKDIDWDEGRVLARRRESLYLFDHRRGTFNEDDDVSAQMPEKLEARRRTADLYLEKNLAFKNQYPARMY